MRKLIVCNFMSVDGFYDGPNKNIGPMFENYHRDYWESNHFDFYNAERLRCADFLLYSRAAFLGNQAAWPAMDANPNTTPIRHEIAGLMRDIPKLVISDKLSPSELSPWANTQIINDPMPMQRSPNSNKKEHVIFWCYRADCYGRI